MSEIQAHPAQMGDMVATAGTSGKFPYHLITDYGNQLMTIVLDGDWSKTPPLTTPITLTATYDGTSKSAIAICFKLALPGTSVPATLVCATATGTESYPILLSVPPV